MTQRILRAVRRRPVRVLEAVLALLAAVGVTVGPELVSSSEAIVGVLAAVGIVGGEAAQRKTRSKDYVDELVGPDADHDDRLPDASKANPPKPGEGDPDLPDVPAEP